jgi:hypothetical protein
MPRQAFIAFLAGSLIAFTVGMIGLFAVHNDISKILIIAGSAGCVVFMFYVMWASGRQQQQEQTRQAEERERYRNMPFNYPTVMQAELTPQAPTIRQEGLESHGEIIKTWGENGRLTYIKFADGYSIGTPPTEEDKEKRDRYEAVKV